MAYVITNSARSTIAANLGGTALDTTVTIQSSDASKFPVVNHGGVGTDYSYITLEDASGNIEICKVTRHDSGSSSLTVVRAQEGTTVRAWLIGDGVGCRLTAQVINDSFGAAAAAGSAASSAAASASAAAASAAASSGAIADHLADATDAHDASAISVVPTGGISANTVQDALVELDSEKAAVGHTHSGMLTETTLKGTKRDFTSQQGPIKGTLTDGATVAWDGDTNGQVVKLTTTASRTMGVPTNIVEGNLYVLRLTTGGYTPSWNAAYKWPSGGAPSGLVSGVYVFTFMGGAGNTLEPTGPGYLTGA